jgi:hypothetical protein
MDVVCDYLESYALRVNRSKSFSKSAFRESCGADFYDGVSVLPVYARQMMPADNRKWTASHVMAWIATADQFYLMGKWHLAQHIREVVQDVVGTELPRSRRYLPGLAFLSLTFDTKLRYNPKLCGWRQRRLLYKPLKQKDSIDGDATACFNKVFEGGQDARLIRDGTHSSLEWDRLHEAPRKDGLEPSILCHEPLYSDSVGSESGLRNVLERLRQSDFMGLTEADEIARQGNPFTLSKDISAIAPERRDFHHTTKRGVFALKRQWVTTFS